jgi:hypothetical protein
VIDTPLRDFAVRVVFALSTSCVALGTSGCLVLSLHPAYDDQSLAWDATLVGTWRDAEDNVLLKIDAAEWRSYRVHYEHPVEKGDLTAFLTLIGDARYLDLMPPRGEDRGSFVIPAHAVVRLDRDEDRIVVTPLSYDWFADRLHEHRGSVAGVATVFDQKENALIVAATQDFRIWLRNQNKESAVWGAGATFTRMK